MQEFGSGLVAVDGTDEILGTVLWWPFDAEAAMLGMVLVPAAQQGKGIGRALMQAAMAQAAPRALMLYSTAAGQRLYASLGFRAIGAIRQHQGRLAAPLPASGPARPFKAADRAALLALDAAAFGAPRTALLDRLLRIGEAAVLEAPGDIAGFAIRRAAGRGETIGPIVAASEADAGALIAALSAPGLLRVDIPADATRLASWLGEIGLPCVDAGTAMVRGNWPERSQAPRSFALVSQALG